MASLGIDVVAVHPSPVASNFYNDLDHKVEMIEAAAKSAVPPSDLPDDIFRSIGGAALRDLGGKLGKRIEPSNARVLMANLNVLSSLYPLQ